MTSGTQTAEPPGEDAAALPNDSGLRLRAIELALSPFPGLERVDASRLALDVKGDARSMAEGLDDLPDVTARLRSLDCDALVGLARKGASWLVCAPTGWLVARGGRVDLVTSQGEHRVACRRGAVTRALGARGPHEVALVEPRLALESLSVRAHGTKNPWRRLAALVTLEAPEIVAMVVYAIVLGGLSLAVPVAVQVLVNTIAFGSLLQPLIILATLLLGVLLFSGLLQLLEWYAVEVLARRIFVRLAEDFTRRLATIPHALHSTFDIRELSNRFFEVVTLQKTGAKLLLDGLGLVLQTAVGMLLLGFYHPWLLAFDIALVVGLGAVIILGYGAIPTAKAESETKYRMASWLQTIASHPHMFRRRDGAMLAALRSDALTREYLAARRRHFAVVFRQLAGGVVVQALAMVALLGIGGWLVIARELTLGQLVAAELVVGVVASSYAKLGKHLEAAYDVLASVDKVGKVVDLPAEGSAMRARRGVRGPCDVAFEGVELGGRAFSLRIDAGARVALAVPDPNPLLEALAGLRSCDAGVIRIGPPEAPSPGFLVRPTDVVEGSIFDNLRAADLEVDDARAWQALRAVALDDVVRALPDGLQTRLLGTGRPFSPQQVARLALARAVVARPRLVLIDRALDDLGLAAPRERDVRAALLGPEAPWTAVVVTSSASVRELCSRTITDEENT